MNELVYAVPAASLPTPQSGLIPFSRDLYEWLGKNGEFGLRNVLEHDEAWRQVVPYAIIRMASRILLLQRTRSGGDARLYDRFTIGVGGHINPIDSFAINQGVDHGDLIQAGLERELKEELEIEVEASQILGFIHQNDNPIARVHTGVLYLLEAEREPRVLETEKLQGGMVSLEAVSEVYAQLESWSQVAFNALTATPTSRSAKP